MPSPYDEVVHGSVTDRRISFERSNTNLIFPMVKLGDLVRRSAHWCYVDEFIQKKEEGRRPKEVGDFLHSGGRPCSLRQVVRLLREIIWELRYCDPGPCYIPEVPWSFG